MNETARIARRMSEIDPFWAMDLVAEAKRLEQAGRDIVHMQVGEPDFPTAAPILEAGLRAAASGDVRYTSAIGITPLREAISRFYSDRHGVDVPVERIIVTPGASGALLLVAGTLVNPGDQVAIADPGYPCNRHFIRLMEGEAVRVPVGPATNWQLTSTLIGQVWTDRMAGALIGSPSNPTGTILPDAGMQSLIAAVGARGGFLIVDEIYHGLTYGDPPSTALRFSEDVFVINSFSKYFGMTGWRLGWVVAPLDYVRDLDKLAQNVFLSPPTISQHAALAAFAPETIAILEERREEFRRRRDFLVPALRELGFEVPVVPEGAFYVYADVSRFTDDSFTFAYDVLKNAGVAFTPGRDFGSNAAGRHARFAYTTSLARLEEGVGRLRRYLTKSSS